MSKPTVLFLGTLPPHRGGTGTINRLVLNGLDALGHKIVAITTLAADDGCDPRAYLAAGIALYTVEIAAVRLASMTPTNSEMVEECRRIVEIGRKAAAIYRPDVVLVARADFKDPGLEIAASLDVPVVAVDHGASTAHLHGFHAIADVHRIGRLLEDAACIVSVASHRAAKLHAFGLENVVAIPNAADTQLFRPGPKNHEFVASLGLPADAPLIAHVSNMKPYKQVDDFLDTVARLIENDADLRALVVGEGPTRVACEARVQSLGIADRVKFTGWLERDGMAAIYRSVELIMQPSEIEAAPLAVLEAMASGCAVVASDIRAHREMMQHDRTGVLVPFGDVDAYSRAIASLLDEPERRRQITDAALESSRLRTVEAMVAAYSEVLTSVAQLPKTARSLQPSECGQSTASE